MLTNAEKPSRTPSRVQSPRKVLTTLERLQADRVRYAERERVRMRKLLALTERAGTHRAGSLDEVRWCQAVADALALYLRSSVLPDAGVYLYASGRDVDLLIRKGHEVVTAGIDPRPARRARKRPVPQPHGAGA